MGAYESLVASAILFDPLNGSTLGTPSAAASWITAPNGRQAWSVQSGKYIQYSAIPIPAGQVTFCCRTSKNSTFGDLFAARNGGDWNGGTGYWVQHGGTTMVLRGAGGTASLPASSNDWSSHVVAFDGTSVTYYRNGAFVASGTVVSGTGYTGIVRIGNRGTGDVWDGPLQDVMILPGVATAGDASVYHSGPTDGRTDLILDPACVGYWPLQETSGTSYANLKAGGLAGASVTNASSLTQADGPGYGLARSIQTSGNSNGTITIDATPLFGALDWSFGLWHYITGYGGAPAVIAVDGGSTSNLLVIYLADNSGGNGVATYQNGAVRFNENGATRTGWHHFHFNRSGEVYVDGEPIGTAPATFALPASGTLRLGGYAAGPQYSGGKHTGFYAMTRSLTAAEVLRMMTGELPASSNRPLVWPLIRSLVYPLA
jgi:hypothetical protein